MWMLPKLKRFIAKKIVLGDRNLKNQEKKKLTGKTKGKKKTTYVQPFKKWNESGNKKNIQKRDKKVNFFSFMR